MMTSCALTSFFHPVLAALVPHGADHTPVLFWILFNAGVLFLLALDLFVFHRRAKTPTLRSSLGWTAFWVTLSLLFGAVVWFWKGPTRGLEFFTGYLVEYSLSVDNIFLFVLIFRAFAVPPEFQHRCLLWGILGALAMRGVMIGLGAALIERFDWILYVFGSFLVFAGFKMFFGGESAPDPEKNRLLRFTRRLFPVSTEFDGPHFVTRRTPDGRRALTPLALTLVLVESTDLIFALDSIPAVFAVTRDAFIVYTSNVCAILGLRTLYFLLAGVVDRFVYLKHGLAVVLVFVGVKMLGDDYFHLPPVVSLGVIIAILTVAIGLSLLRTRGQVSAPASAPVPGAEKRKGADEKVAT